MKILLTYDPPPIGDRNHDWRAIDPDTYDAEIDDRGVAVTTSPIGHVVAIGIGFPPFSPRLAWRARVLHQGIDDALTAFLDPAHEIGKRAFGRLPKTLSLMRMLTRADIEALPPFERRNFAAMCKLWAERAEAIDAKPAKAGVLGKLGDGDRSE